MPVLYETKWNGIDLLDIAKNPQNLTAGFPNERFYGVCFERLLHDGPQLSASWLKTKERIATQLREWIQAYATEKGCPPKAVQVLSIGAGFGIPEGALLEQGYDITLHEVSDAAFEYTKKLYPKIDPKKLITCELNQLKPESFDFVFIGSCEYCLSNNLAHENFLKEIASTLRTNGIVVAWDPTPVIKNYVRMFLNFLTTEKEGVPWGVLRSPSHRMKQFRKAGFFIKKIEYVPLSWEKIYSVKPNAIQNYSPILKARNAIIHGYKKTTLPT